MALEIKQAPDSKYILTFSESCISILQWIQDHNYPLKLTIDRVPYDFYLDASEDLMAYEREIKARGIPSVKHYLGYVGFDSNLPKTPLSPKEQLISIQGKVIGDRYELPADYAHPRSSFSWFPGFSLIPLYNETEIDYGYYSLPALESAYQALLPFIPNLKKRDLALIGGNTKSRGYNPYLIEKREYINSEGCLNKETIAPGEKVIGYSFYICSLDSDMERNVAAIKALLSEMQGEYIS